MSPLPALYQTLGMPLAPDSLAPGLDANGFISNIAYKVKVIAKVAAYTVKASESGAIFTNRGATAAVTFTLPPQADGLIFEFYVIADFAVTVAADIADTMTAINDDAADSVAYDQTSLIMGGGFRIFSDGTSWNVMALPGQAIQTVTVAS